MKESASPAGRLDAVPTTEAAPADARPSDVVARLRALRPNRRVVLRGLVVAATAAALVPLDWYLNRREAAAAPDDRSEHETCAPAQYREEANNWWSGGPAVCYGGWRRGSYPCSDGFHREGRFDGRGETYTSTRLTTNCRGKNAWRWNGYRCSDAVTTATFADGTEYTAVTIAACEVGGAPAPVPTDRGAPPRREPRPAPRDSDDPSRPQPLLPDLGLGSGSLPAR
ncbi:MAG TPA: hypothetical protein VM367_18480 [Pseudonocardia sp.]|nr:hypothetical protein [Pseudonocardia sp.]